MAQLYEDYRPRQWSEIVGQEKALALIESLRPRGFGGRAFWITGASGTGKTTIARLLAGEVADDFNTEDLAPITLTAQKILELERQAQMKCLGSKSGRALIVNEAHGLRDGAIGQFLDTLERIPAHVVWIFTTTSDGAEKLFDDHDDGLPFLSRCQKIALARRDLSKPFAARIQAVCQSAGLGNPTIEQITKKLVEHKNNMRAVLQLAESGAFLE